MTLGIAIQEHPTQIQTWKIASQCQRKKCINIGPKTRCELVLGGYWSSYISQIIVNQKFENIYQLGKDMQGSKNAKPSKGIKALQIMNPCKNEGKQWTFTFFAR
jgi:hypothetical protein